MSAFDGSSERHVPSSSSSFSRTIKGSKAEMISSSRESFWAVIPTFAPPGCSTEPESGSECPARRSSRVVFPAPLRPTSPIFSPASTESLALERTFRSPPWYFTRSLATITFMTQGLYKQDPLTPEEREELEDDLIAFCDRELDLLGDISGLDVLYAGGSSLLWIEGLSQRVGESGSVTAIDMDAERVEDTQASLGEAELTALVHLLAGDVFGMPFGPSTFDLVYSSGLFHELDVKERGADDALAALHFVARHGGRVATSDFVDSEPAVQLEEEMLEAELRREAYARNLYGIGPPERLVGLHEKLLTDVRGVVSPPRRIRHLGKVVLAEDEPAELSLLPPTTARRLRESRDAVRGRILGEGYTRPATLYVEGLVQDA